MTINVFLKIETTDGIVLDIELELQFFVEDTNVVAMLHYFSFGFCLVCLSPRLRLFHRILQLKLTFLAIRRHLMVRNMRYRIVSMWG